MRLLWVPFAALLASSASAQVLISSGSNSGLKLHDRTGTGTVFRLDPANGRLDFVANGVVVASMTSGGALNAKRLSATEGIDLIGSLTVTSTLTVQGPAFSVGAGTLAVTGGSIGLGTSFPQNIGAWTLPGRALNVYSGDNYANLALRSTVAPVIWFENSAASAGRRLFANGYVGNNLKWVVHSDVDGSVQQADAVVFTNTGSVGISTAAPQTTLEVNGSASFGAGAAKSTFSATGDLTVRGSFIAAGNRFGVDSGGDIHDPGGNIVGVDDSMQLNGSNSQFRAEGIGDHWFRGNVGAGTDAPTARLHVSSPSAITTANILLVSTGVASNQHLMVVKADGKVGFNTLSPASEFVVDTTRLGSPGGTLVLGNNGSFGDSVRLGVNGRIASQNSGYRIEAETGVPLTLETGDATGGGYTERLKIINTGEVGVGVTPTARLHVSSAGAVASNTLLLVSSGTGVGQELLTVKGDGKVGIGLANPGHPLDVAGAVRSRGYFELAETDGSRTGILALHKAVTGSGSDTSPTLFAEGSRSIHMMTGGQAISRMVLEAGGEVGIGADSPAARLHVSSTSAVAANTLFLVSSGTAAGQELLTVQGDGRVGVGTTAPGAKLGIKMTTAGFGNGLAISNRPGDQKFEIVPGEDTVTYFRGDPTYTNGTLSNSGVWGDGSDLAWKENIVALNKYGMETIMKLRPVEYTMKNTGKAQIGFIAQEVRNIIPEIVNGTAVSDGGTGLSLEYSHLTPLLTKSVQELASRNAELEGKLSTMQTEMAELRKLVKESCRK